MHLCSRVAEAKAHTRQTSAASLHGSTACASFSLTSAADCLIDHAFQENSRDAGSLRSQGYMAPSDGACPCRSNPKSKLLRPSAETLQRAAASHRDACQPGSLSAPLVASRCRGPFSRDVCSDDMRLRLQALVVHCRTSDGPQFVKIEHRPEVP